ncbi:MAG: hypothetical protein WD969_11140, partial [Paracoccaceae bacterium]
MGHATDENGMIPGLMHGVGLAFENREAFPENRAAIFADAIVNAFKTVVARHGKPVGQGPLIRDEDVHGEAPARQLHLAMAPLKGEAEQHEG